jgi:iron complex outermembrane receptor protein
LTLTALFAAGLISVQAAGVHSFDVRAGRADQAVNRLAAQAGVDVVISEDLRRRRTQALSGRMTAEAALERLLRPLGARAVRIGDRMYRIEAAPQRLSRAPAPDRITEPTSPAQLSEVIVTAAPPVGVTAEPGRSLLDPGALERMQGLPASDAIADLSATVDSTRQGTGRNKLFVRGLADSALNGPLQATVGQYFGDLRLSFGSPDPDLTLIDIRRVEVFEGPQGTRFGVGSIGGVLRLHPREPVLEEASGQFQLGGGATSGGGESGDASLVLNQPLGDNTAYRLVAYGRREGGFLDNAVLGMRETDVVDTVGARAAVRWSSDVWTLDVTGLAQRVSAGDAQTVSTGQNGLARTGEVLEPYESTILLGGATARRRWGPFRLTSATSIGRQRLDERFDASSRYGGPAAVVDRSQTATNLSSELRIDTDELAGWTLSGGAAVALGETTVERRHRTLSDPAPVYGADLRRSFSEATAFGEASLAPAPTWRFAIGARLSAVRIDSDLRYLETGRLAARDRNGISVRMTPSVSARWDPTPAVTVFGRLEQAVRPAGVGEASGAFSRYNGDRVTLLEVGARSRDWRDDLSGEVSVGWVEWRDVQADIVTPGGDLVTDNVGDGMIRFLSLKAAWRPSPALDVSAGLFINDSSLTPTRPGVIGGGRTDIPNVAPLGAQLSLNHEAGELAGLQLRLGADLRYVGQSRLGVGPALDVPQGGYLRSELTARLGDERAAVTLRVSNPFDQTGIRYGIGSPYQLSEPQSVPVRPLTVRLSFDAAF